MWTSTRGEGGGPAHVDACGQGGEGVKNVIFFWDVINGWPLSGFAQAPSHTSIWCLDSVVNGVKDCWGLTYLIFSPLKKGAS